MSAVAERRGTKRSPISAHHQTSLGPWVPVATMLRVIEEAVAEYGVGLFSELAGVDQRLVWRLQNESTESSMVSFKVADRLITNGVGDSSLWHSDPELAAIYKSAVMNAARRSR